MTVSNLKILVVEDSQTALADLTMKLSSFVSKEQIFPAKNYDEAVVLLDQHKFDIAFVDLHMPRKTGMDLIIDVIQKNPKTKELPVVVTTAMDPDSFVTFTLKPHTYRYLFKPIELLELEEAITGILDKGND